MFEIHSRSMGLSVFSGVYLFSEAYLNGGALFFSRLCATLPSCLLLVTNTDTHRHTQTHKHTHIPAERPNPTLHILTHTGASRPQIQASRCCHGDHFDPVSTSEVCLERGNLPPPHPSLFPRPLPSSFSFQGKKKKKNPIHHSQESWLFLLLFFLSDSFTHNVWHQQSPLLLLSLPLHTAFLSVCAPSADTERERERERERESGGGSASAADFNHTGWVKRR